VSDLTIQASFNSGEWSPKLFARVDIAKYKSGAATLENWFVDYRGGASTRPGTKYILQCYKSATAVRLIPFQASFSVGYVLEFGDQYIRFFFDGAPVVETATTITASTPGAPVVFTDNAHGYVDDDWIFVSGKYYIIDNATPNTFTLTDLVGNAINTNPFVLPTSASRVYTIASPYAAADLALVKFAQNVNQLILCHPSYAPHVLTLISPTNWNILPIVFGTTATPPGGLGYTTSLSGGSVYYSYGVTSVDANGQESTGVVLNIGALTDLRTTAGSITISWTLVPGAISYNIYKTNVSYSGPVPVGQTYGYIGSSINASFVDDNIGPDFSQTPPVPRNPFEGSGVSSVTVTNAGTYTTVPSVSFTGAASAIAASAAAFLQVQGTPTVGAGGAGYAPGDLVSFTNGVILIVATVAAGVVTAWSPITTVGSSPGLVSSGSTPANPVVQVSTTGGGTGATANLVWGVGVVQVLNQGAGYVAVPTVTFNAGAAAATAVLSATSNGYPSVPGFFQQRLVLAAPLGSPQTFYMSQPGAYFNFNVSTIAQADDAITGTLVSGQLNTIRAMISQPTGLLMLTDRNSWLINGGTGQGSAVSPFALVANAQSYNGISDVPLIVANFDVLYVQAKGSIIRDSTYNIYSNVYTGTDISAIASHLFYGYTINEWAWAEEPFKLAWAVRSDGAALALTFLKEQEFIGWTHSFTLGSFKSVATVVESTLTAGEVDAVYWVIERDINGQTLKYIERLAERAFPNGVADAWCVDCGINYTGVPETNFTGAEFLAGETVTGLADGVVIPPFVMPANGEFALTTAASKVTVGLGFTCKLQTLPLDLGDPTIQGKVKKINAVDARVADTLGLYIGAEFGSHMVRMKDLVVGNVSSMLTGQSSQRVTDLVDGDARTFLDPTFTVPGQYCIEQRQPLPATVLGLISDYTVGDGGQRGNR
jgi:hypothetical protein